MEVLQVPDELARMMDLYRAEKPQRVLEIGSWDGGTLREWLENAVPGATVAAVDMNHRNQGAYEEWRKPDTTLLLHTGNSIDAAAKDFIAANGPYDWVFIDGDHSVEYVRADWANCYPHVNDGGLVLFHDITPPAGIEAYPPGDLVRELSRTFETWEITDPDSPCRDARGIGVVRFKKGLL